MKTFTSAGDGTLDEEFTVFPGGRYSLYVRKSDDSPPAAGEVAFFHKDGAEIDAIITFEGADVYLDLGSADGLTAEFIAHSNKLSVTGIAMGSGKNIRLGLVPIRS